MNHRRLDAKTNPSHIRGSSTVWTGGRAVDCAPLIMEWAFRGLAGSNPALIESRSLMVERLSFYPVCVFAKNREMVERETRNT